jgi:hypothetical protein
MYQTNALMRREFEDFFVSAKLREGGVVAAYAD